MKYTVVVAEDEMLLLDDLVKKINNSGLKFEVIGAAQTGIQAYELIEDCQPDVLITDIRMPAMDGLELIKKTKNFYPSINCIIVSGFSDFEYAQTAIHYQVTDYLLKPIDKDDLHKTLLALQNSYMSREKNNSEIFNEDIASLSQQELAHMLQEYLKEHYSEDIKLSQIASDLNYSSSYLTKVFCHEYDCSPSKYMISLRIQKAQQLLRHNPELSIRQIGEAVGYPEQGYFSRIFKKQTHYSPLDYRESAGL